MKEIVGYHGTKLKVIESIVSDNFKIAPHGKMDNHWLGHGVYFFSDYELAEWWAQTKVNVQNRKYGLNDQPGVIKAKICANNIMDLDNPFQLNRFIDLCKRMQDDIVKRGIVIDFTKNMKNPKDSLKILERKRCYFMDLIKEDDKVDVIIYTFSKNSPSYAGSKYHKDIVKEYGLSYNERQICVTSPEFIVERVYVNEKEEFDEVII